MSRIKLGFGRLLGILRFLKRMGMRRAGDVYRGSGTGYEITEFGLCGLDNGTKYVVSGGDDATMRGYNRIDSPTWSTGAFIRVGCGVSLLAGVMM
jgi:hypothetical protein